MAKVFKHYNKFLLISFFVLAILTLSATCYSQVVQRGAIIEFQLKDVRLNLEEATPVEEQFYLDDKVKPTDIKLKEGLNADGIMARFNLLDDLMELYMDDYVLVLKGSGIAHFSQGEVSFMRGAEISDFEADRDVFYRKIYGGSHSKLFMTEGIEVKAANYNEALGVGEKADRYVKTKTFYLIRNREILFKAPTSKKIYKFLTGQSKEVKVYAKNQLIRPDEAGLISLLDYIDSNLRANVDTEEN